MVSMLEQIEKLISDQNQLAELYKELRQYQFEELLKNELNDEIIYINDIKYKFKIESLISSDDWYELLEFSNDSKELADDMFQHKEALKIVIKIINKEEYYNLHPTIEKIEQMINNMYDIDDFKLFIEEYYNNKINHYYKYLCQVYHILDNINVKYNIKIKVIKDVSFIAKKLYNYCMKYEIQPKDIINKFDLYEFIINLDIVLVYFEINTKNDIYLPNPLQI